MGNFDRAIDTAALIPDQYKRETALRDISKDLVQVGNFDKAIDVAALITTSYKRDPVLSDISLAREKAGK